jgi:hypothetical protein
LEHLTRVQRNYKGEIISFQTSEGRIISYQKALLEVGNGLLAGTNIELDQDGEAYLYNSDEADKEFSNFPSIY